MMWGDLSPHVQIRLYAEMVMMGYGGSYQSLLQLEPWKMNVIMLEMARSYREKMRVNIEAFKGSPGAGV